MGKLIILFLTLGLAQSLQSNSLVVKLPETDFNFEQIEKDAKLIEEAIGARRKRFRFEVKEPVKGSQIAAFVFLQAADVYTTYRGLKYNCVKELNPIVGERPSISTMIFTKAAILTPAFQYDIKQGNLSPKLMSEMNFVMSAIIANNYDVLRDAKKYCTKR